MTHEGQTWSSGNCRVTYHLEWDTERPFVTYRNGTAGAHFGTLSQAWRYLFGESLPGHFSQADDSPTRQEK